MDALRKAAISQANFSAQLADMGYKTITTFYGDLTIAEAFGPEGVRETYARVNKEWRDNYKYYPEFVLALNFKIWEHHKTNEPLARVYDELWREADEWIGENWTGEAAQHYFEVTD